MNTHETVVDLLQRRASGPGGTTFLLDGRAGQEHLSFAELDRRARAIGAELVARGATGERVLLLYPPGLAYVAAFFGCLYAGAVAVPVYPPRPDRPLSRFLAILSDARPAFALTTEPIRQLGEALLGPHAALDWLATDTMSLDPADSWRRPDVDRRSLAFLQYTSGSTADPKGVRVTHGNLLHNEAQIQRAFDTDASSRIVGWLPLYHDMGLIGNVLHPLYLGADCVLMSPLEFLRDPLWWLEAVSEHRGVVSGGPNFAFDLCVRKATPEVLARLDLSSWRVAFNGAEPVRPDTMARFAETFGPCGFRGDAFLPCYGLAEGTLLVSAGRDPRPTWFRADALERKVAIPVAPGSDSGRALSQSGVFLPGSVRIVDPASRAEVEPGAVGEIWVRSDSVADGYWGRAELTESTFRATTAAGDGPFLRTGDLGFLQGDRLFVAGREKDLLIVRGRNHYPQDLERTAELAHPSLRPGCAAAFAIDRDGEERAVVVVEVGAPPQDPAAVVDAVRAAVARDHEVVLDAVVLIAARTLPKTSSGKVQRRACRAAWLAGELAVVHGSSPAPAPRPAAGSDLARFLAQRVSALAGVPASPEAPLSRFALDSLQLAELARSVDDRFGVRVPVDLLFTDRSIGAVAELLDALPRSAGGVDGRSDGLSVGQRALWFLDRLDPDGAGAYLVANAVELRGPLDEAALAAAFDQLVERHPLLRTVWPAVDGEPRPAPAPRRPRLVCDPAASLDDEARRPFRLDQDAPIRAVLARRGPPVLLVVTHHLVTDLWSQALLLEELGALYEAARDRRPASLPPADDFGRYVAWQEALLAGPDGERLERSWLDALGAEVPPLALPTRPRPPVASTAGDQVSFALDPHTSERVLGLARARAVTPFVLLLAAYETLLYRYTGQRELVVGTVASGRSRPEHARMIGYFVNALPLRASLSPDQPFGALLGATRAAVARAFRDQDLPFARLVELARPERDLSRAPLFQTMFALQQGAVGGRSVSGFAVNAPGARLDWAGLELRPVPLDRRIAQFDLGLTMAEVDGRLYGTFDFPVALFDRGFVAAMAERFVTLLQGIVAQPDAPLRALPVVSDRERDAQVAGWSATERPLDDRPVHVRFAAAALASPDAVAVACAGARVSYAELDARSARWARALVARGVGPEQIVGLCLERTPALPAAVLAVLRAGGAWLPLDPAQPAARRDQLAADAGAALVLSDADLAGLDVEIVPSDPPAIVQSDPSATAQSDPSAIVQSDPPLPRIGGEGGGEGGRSWPDGAAAVVYTSGSTGAPRGVVLTHRGLANLVDSFVESYGATASDRILPATSLGSASFVGELLPLWCVGGAVVIPTAEQLLDDAALAALIEAEQVTIVSTVPSRLPRVPASVRCVLSGGEALTAAPDLDGVELVNGYGLTETTVCSTYGRVRELPAPLGRPVRNTRVYVLDEALGAVPPGVEGDLYVAGVGLARGYHGAGGATGERFVPDPFHPGERMFHTGDRARFGADGTLWFAGRVDHQVKVRGHRIELEEVEAQLARHPGVERAAVTAHGDGAERRLCAYVVPRAGPVPVAELLAWLRERLPDAYVPASITALSALPTSANGKVDRRALPEPERARPDIAPFASPRGEVEREVGRLWASVLGLDQVGVHDNFFDLGGHSLLLGKLHARLVAELGARLTLVDLFRYPTVAAQAEHLGGQLSAAAPIARPAPRPPAREPLAIIGLAGRFPGAPDVDQLWRNLLDGVEGITFFSADELRAAGVDAASIADPAYVRAKGALGAVDQFDASFFGYSPREAELVDPQQRMFLECAWEAVERAGVDPSRFSGRIGVFGGVSMNTYLLLNLLPHMKLVASLDTLQASLGNDKDTLTSRVSYKLGLTGPSITIQSASSTSLVAVHVACEAVLAGTCDLALAGGASIHVPETSGYLYQPGGTTAIDGHCRAYDADATGFVSGNGAGVVLIKRLSEAVRDRDHIHAVIRSTACNNDGANKVSWTAPSVDGQADVVRAALDAAGITPGEVGYVEGHGTGTALGDPIELAALNAVFEGVPAGSCALGSMKTNIGHLDTAAGVCGLIKAALCVEHGELVPTLHFRAPNPRLELGPFTVNTERRRWTKSPRIAGVTSLGMGGTNAHVVLSEPPPAPTSGPSRAHQLLCLSARTPSALDAVAGRLADQLERDDVALADVAYTLARGRRGFEHRRWVVAPDRDGAVAALRAGSGGRGRSDGSRAVAFLFPGQGAQYAGMGHGLYTEEPAYRVALDQAAAAFLPHLGFDLRDVVHGGDDEALARTAVTQPALFAVSWSVAQWLLAHGVRPDALVGHSVGEFVAAQLAGVFTLEDAAALVAARGRRMMAMAPGAMLAVSAPAEGLSPPDGVEIAAVNHPDACVVAGPADAVRAYATALARDGVTARELRTSHAFHSASMDEASVAFARDVAQVGRSAPTLPFLSNVTGGWIRPADAVDPAYWGRQMRAPVRFADGAAELLRDPTRLCVEVGPGRTLAQLVRSHPRRSADQGVVTTLRHPRERDADQATALGALGACWAAGGPVPDLFAGEERRTVVLPTYPFERKRHWVEPLVVEAPRPVSGREPVERWGWAPVWEQRPRPAPRDPRSTWFAGDPAVARALGGTFAPEPLGEAPPARVVWAVPEGDPLEGALFGPLAWVRAFVTRFPGAPVELCLVTTGAADVLGTEVLVPGRAAVAGPVRVLPLEVAGLTARWIDVDGLDALADELRDGDAPEVALRGRRRWVRGHARVTPPAAEVRPGSTWLVTGGAGGVGAAIAGWLGARGANLVLVGRTLGVPSGPTVEGVAADVSTDAGAEAAVRAALARFGGLHGVVHAAGVPGGRLALRDDREVAERVLAPKVSGLAALERALRGLELDHLVLCSSLTAEVALPGQVDYVAANAVLDATAAARARDGLPWVSIGWDAWGEVGMAARAAEPDGDAAPALAFRAQMMRDAATTTEALSWFARALGGAPGPLVLSTHPLPARLAAPRSLVDVPRAAVRVAPAGVEARLEALWRELLGVDSVGPHDNFFDLGGSSLIGIRLVGRIRSELGVELSEVDLFEAPTLASLTSRVRGTAEVEVPVEVVDRARRRRERRITERGES